MPHTHDTKRRQFIAALSSCLWAFSVSGSIAATNTAAQKIDKSDAITTLAQICNALCGTTVSNPALTKQYLQVLAQNLDPKQLQDLLDLHRLPEAQWAEKSRSAPIQEGAEFALQLWMSGMTPSANSQVLTYTDAPVWMALSSFTKPPAVCGGGFGYWSAPPA